MVHKHKIVAIAFIVLAAIYLIQTLVITPDQAALNKYHLTSEQATLLSLTIAVPFVCIWTIAFTGYARLSSYAAAIKKSRDGEAFYTISKGVLLLALWLPLSTVFSNLSSQLNQAHILSRANAVRLDNYFNIILIFVALVIAYLGSRKLLPLVRLPSSFLSEALTLVYLAFAVAYSWLVLNDPLRNKPDDMGHYATYYVSDWLIILTVIIPRLIAWFLGLQTALNILLYRRRIKGIIYRKALRNLSAGLTGVVISLIVLRCIQSLSYQLDNLGLNSLLLIIYALLILISIGYLYIASGAKQLIRIEES